MDVTFITVDRQPQYIQSTLTSFFSDLDASLCRVRVLVDGVTTKHLGEWVNDPRIVVEVLNTAEVAQMTKTTTPHYRAAINSARAVQGSGALLFCHDDLQFTWGWAHKLQEIIHRIGINKDFLLSLWSSTDFPSNASKYTSYDPSIFFGDIAYYASPKARERLRGYLWENGYEKWTKPADLLVQDFCIKTPNTLFVAVPNLVQHMGATSTGCSGWYPTSPTFVP